jgi:hypothetical protein
LFRAIVNVGETILDLPKLRIYLNHVQVVVMKCMSRNTRWTAGVKHVNTILQNLMKSTNLWTANEQDDPNLTFRESALDQIHDDPFRLLPFGTSPIRFHKCPIGTNLVDCILVDFNNDSFQCICLSVRWWSTLPLNHGLMGTTGSARSMWNLLDSQCWQLRRDGLGGRW